MTSWERRAIKALVDRRMRELTADVRREDEAPVEGTKFPHGTETCYVKGRCRCAECRAAGTEARNRRKRRLREQVVA